MATCPLCNDTKTQEIHGPTGFLSRNCPNCVVEEPVAEPSTGPNISTNLDGHVDGLTLNGTDPTV